MVYDSENIPPLWVACQLCCIVQMNQLKISSSRMHLPYLNKHYTYSACILTWINRPHPAHSSVLFPNDVGGGASTDVSGLLGFAIGSDLSCSSDGLPMLPSQSLLLLLLLLLMLLLIMLFGGVIASFLHSVK